MNTESNLKFPIIFLFASVTSLWFGCGTKVQLERKYDLEEFFGNWEAQSAVVMNSNNRSERIQINVPRYGQVNCRISPDSSFTLNINVYRDIVLNDDQSWLSIQHVLVHQGYRMFISGTYEYKDSSADFYNYNYQKHFRSVLYTYGHYFYLTYTDEKQNEWEFQFEKANKL